MKNKTTSYTNKIDLRVLSTLIQLTEALISNLFVPSNIIFTLNKDLKEIEKEFTK